MWTLSLFLGILEVLYCVLIESPEVLNIIQENHIKSIISLLDKHGRNHKVGYISLPGTERENKLAPYDMHSYLNIFPLTR